MFTGLLSHTPEQPPNRYSGDTTQQPFYFPLPSLPQGQTMRDCFQRSRAMLLAIPVVLLVVLACAGPVSAATIDISVSGDIPYMVMTPGITSQNTSVHLTVTSDTATWTVVVKDASDDGKPPSWAGRMVEWDGSGYVTPSPKVLGANMMVTGATITGSSGSSATLSSDNQIIESGTAAVTSLEIPLTFAQEVAYTDPHLTAPNHVYRIVVTFTGAPS
jgi:hypothetical protein